MLGDEAKVVLLRGVAAGVAWPELSKPTRVSTIRSAGGWTFIGFDNVNANSNWFSTPQFSRQNLGLTKSIFLVLTTA
jgi:hypothetical protein